jgi:leader peptidase (prepilin peptidase) / N-methyltransferase
LQFAIGALVFVLGLFVGFVVNVIATRLNAHKPLFGPLGCTRSPHRISPAQAIPLVGYLAQRGRCSTCDRPISAAYPLTELLTASVITALYWFEGLSVAFAFHSAYVAVLVLVLVLDWKHRDIYFSIIIAGSLIAVAGLLLIPGLDLVSGLIAALVAGGFFLLAYLVARLIFPHIEEPLGMGDVLLALMMGLMLGFPNIVGALLIGPLIAGAVAMLLLLSRRTRIGDFIPYGVSLCFATILFIVYPTPFANFLHLPALSLLVNGLFR